MKGIAQFDAWIPHLESLPLECDGMSRVIATLLDREGIDHAMHVGALDVEGVGRMVPHFWVELGEPNQGVIVDFAARMWLGDNPAVPHGFFQVGPMHRYQSQGTLDGRLDPVLFTILCGKSLDDFPAIDPLSLASNRRRPGV